MPKGCIFLLLLLNLFSVIIFLKPWYQQSSRYSLRNARDFAFKVVGSLSCCWLIMYTRRENKSCTGKKNIPVVSLDFSVTYFLLTVPWPWGLLSPEWKWASSTLPGGKGGRWREADNLTTFMCRMSRKSGSLNLLEPSGPHRACYGAPLPFILNYTTSTAGYCFVLGRCTVVTLSDTGIHCVVCCGCAVGRLLTDITRTDLTRISRLQRASTVTKLTEKMGPLFCAACSGCW
jgi:hypothetical protein